MSRYVISDLHLGHKNIHKFRSKGFEGLTTAEDHWEAAYEGLLSIPKRATIFLMGDIAFTDDWLDKIKELPCKNKILLAGNHDLEGKNTMGKLVGVYDQIFSLHKYKGYWKSHAPIHPSELRGKANMHGHTHYELMLWKSREGMLIDPRYINVCVEYTGYKPIKWEYATSAEYRQECANKWDTYTKDTKLNLIEEERVNGDN